MTKHIVTVPKGNVPYIGIPVPGERPFVVSREKFIGTIAGINVTDWTIRPTAEGGRVLELTHVTGARRGRSLMIDQAGSWTVSRALADWCNRKRKELAKPKLTSAERTIAKLRKQLSSAQYGCDKPPVHPLIPSRRDADMSYYHPSILNWKDDKAQRKALANIAGQFLRFKITDTTAYRLVREAGFKLRYTYSQRRVSQKAWSTSDYWRNIYTVAGLQDRPWYVKQKPDQFDLQEVHRARTRYLAAKAEAYMLKEQISALEEVQARKVPSV